MKDKIENILGKDINGATLRLLSDSDIENFASMKIKEMQYHIEGARKFGIEDNYCINFNAVDALKDLDDYTTLVIDYAGKTVGFTQLSDFPYYGKNNSGVQINNLYIKEEYRNKGIATSIIKELRANFDNITLEVWYEIDSLDKYRHMGFREIAKVMLLD